eukprot:512647-Prymnesium_polylepis.1
MTLIALPAIQAVTPGRTLATPWVWAERSERHSLTLRTLLRRESVQVHASTFERLDSRLSLSVSLRVLLPPPALERRFRVSPHGDTFRSHNRSRESRSRGVCVHALHVFTE